MVIDPLIFFILSATSIFVSIAFFVLASSYAKILKAHHDKEQELETYKKESEQKAIELTDDARQKALQIIEEANKSASKILGDASKLNNFSNGALIEQLQNMLKAQQEKLQQTSVELLTSYKQAVVKLEEDNINTVKTITEDIKKQTLTEVETFKNLMEKETIDSQKQVEAKINEEYQIVEQELQKHKSEELAKIDEDTYKVLQVISKEVLGKSLSLEDKEDIVLKAIQSIKEKGDFN